MKFFVASSLCDVLLWKTGSDSFMCSQPDSWTPVVPGEKDRDASSKNVFPSCVAPTT